MHEHNGQALFDAAREYLDALTRADEMVLGPMPTDDAGQRAVWMMRRDDLHRSQRTAADRADEQRRAATAQIRADYVARRDARLNAMDAAETRAASCNLCFCVHAGAECY